MAASHDGMSGLPRAVHIVQSLDARNGGTSVSVPALAAAVADDGRYMNSVLHFGCERQITPYRIPLVSQPSSGFSLLLPTMPRKALSTTIERSDVVHVHGLWTEHSIATMNLVAASGKPVVVSAHGMLDAWALRHKKWKKAAYAAVVERRSLNRATCLRALTATEAGNYRAFGLRPPIAVIPNGVMAPDRSDAGEFLKAYPQLSGKRIVLFMGRLHAKKGVNLLVEAWNEVQRVVPDAHLVLAGPDDGVLQLVPAESRSVLANGGVTITGMLTGSLKWSAFAASALFVLPSFSEGLSMATLEALWHGVPIMITKGCNFTEAETLDCTFMVQPSVVSLKERLVRVLGLPLDQLQKRGEAGARFVRSRYSWSRAGAQMADVYDWMRGGRPPASVPILTD
jgi:glycosyltransferase involved in cell wall biosynthesis